MTNEPNTHLLLRIFTMRLTSFIAALGLATAAFLSPPAHAGEGHDHGEAAPAAAPAAEVVRHEAAAAAASAAAQEGAGRYVVCNLPQQRPWRQPGTITGRLQCSDIVVLGAATQEERAKALRGHHH